MHIQLSYVFYTDISFEIQLLTKKDGNVFFFFYAHCIRYANKQNTFRVRAWSCYQFRMFQSKQIEICFDCLTMGIHLL